MKDIAAWVRQQYERMQFKRKRKRMKTLYQNVPKKARVTNSVIHEVEAF